MAKKIKKNEGFDRRVLKMSPEELQRWLALRSNVVESKKGKGSFKRSQKKQETQRSIKEYC